MKNIKLRVVSIFILIAIAQVTYSQCSTEIQEEYEDGGAICVSKSEILYEYLGHNDNGNPNQGGYRISSFLSRIITFSEDDLIENNWQIIVAIQPSKNQNTDIVPRKIVIHYTNNTQMTLNAFDYENDNNHEICSFKISDISRFSKGIKKFEVHDTRKGKKLSKKPEYQYILSEQKTCLERY